MEILNEVIIELMKLLNTLNENLSILSSKDGGVVIHDTFANVSTWVDLGITLFATIVGALIGGLITIKLFKQQERMRIKQELKLEFYKEYKPLYKLYIDEIKNLKYVLNTAKYLNESSHSAFEITAYDWLETEKGLKHCKHKGTLDKIIELIKNTTKHMDNLNDYIEMNKINLIDYNGEVYDKLGVDLFLIKNKICELEKWNRQVNIFANRDYTSDEIITKYSEVVKYTIDSYDEIERIINDSINIHLKFEFEFLNQYFKTRWYKRIYTKNKEEN